MKKTRQKMNKPLLIALIISVIVLGTILTTKNSQNPTTDVKIYADAAKLDLYVMSQCPYGIQVENALAPVKEKLGSSLQLNIEFIGSESSPGKFQSLHGEPEVQGNIVQLCAKHYYPDEVINFIVCQNKNPKDLVGSLESCAESNEMDTSKIKTCANGDLGKKLLSESFKKSTQAKATSSPTIYLNGKPYRGGRDEIALLRTVCNAIDSKHEACQSIPKCVSNSDCTDKPSKEGRCVDPNTKEAKCEYSDPVSFEVVVITDKNCNNCDVSEITRALKEMLLGIKVREVDVSEANDLIKENGITKLPSLLFESKIDQSVNWESNQKLQSAFEKVSFGYKLKDEITGATYFVDEEARSAHYEKLGVTKGDNKPQVDFFVMSYCPYGNQAEDALAPVFENLGNSVDFNPHYVIYKNYQGGGKDYCFDDESKYCSMHGVVELNQGLRELCVMDLFGEKEFFDFVLAMNEKCNSKNADSCWTDVAEQLGIDVEAVKNCFDSKALDLLERESKLNAAFGVTGSPAIFIDGEKYDGPRSASGYMGAICDAFEDKPEACDDVESLPEPVKKAAPAGCGV